MSFFFLYITIKNEYKYILFLAFNPFFSNTGPSSESLYRSFVHTEAVDLNRALTRLEPRTGTYYTSRNQKITASKTDVKHFECRNRLWYVTGVQIGPFQMWGIAWDFWFSFFLLCRILSQFSKTITKAMIPLEGIVWLFGKCKSSMRRSTPLSYTKYLAKVERFGSSALWD